MKKVTLLGDSIRLIGYGTKVPALLGDEFTVYQPEDNGRFAKYTLRLLYDLQKEIADSDIIHWNNGLWDACNLLGDGWFSSLEEYKANMLRVADLLLKITPHVIFATTTPVHDKNPHLKNDEIALFNAEIVPPLREKGIVINDLFSTLYDRREKFIRSDDLIHLTDEGIDVCAAQVTEIIKQTAKNE